MTAIPSEGLEHSLPSAYSSALHPTAETTLVCLLGLGEPGCENAQSMQYS